MKADNYEILKIKEGLTREQADTEYDNWVKSGCKQAPDGYPRGNPFWRAATYRVLDERKDDIKKADDFLKKMDEALKTK